MMYEELRADAKGWKQCDGWGNWNGKKTGSENDSTCTCLHQTA